MKESEKKYAIIAGSGLLPREIYDFCCLHNKKCEVILLKGEADQTTFADVKTESIPAYCAVKLLEFLKSKYITHVFIAGKVKRSNIPLFALDKVGRKLLFDVLKNGLNDKTIFQVITKFFEENNIEICSYDFLSKKNHKLGLLNTINVPEDISQKIKQGVKILREISKFDLGQAMIYENGVVLGVECVEGTDELIKRCSLLQQLEKKAILIKICKINQDERVDLPCIGPETIKNIAKNSYAGIVFEVNKTVFLQKEKCCRIADKNKIFIYGI